VACAAESGLVRHRSKSLSRLHQKRFRLCDTNVDEVVARASPRDPPEGAMERACGETRDFAQLANDNLPAEVLFDEINGATEGQIVRCVRPSRFRCPREQQDNRREQRGANVVPQRAFRVFLATDFF